jgi:tRNA dimethylallyltransferase
MIIPTITGDTGQHLIVVGGPTASGKTRLAIALAQQYDTEIISFDSRQCYRELQIGVARPTVDELAEVRHHFIASHSIHSPINAAGFVQFAQPILTGLFEKRRVVVAVGGTGLYIHALVHGLDPIPSIDPSIRQLLDVSYRQNGLNWLQERIQAEDPLYAASGEMRNPHRILRALEVIRGTGKSIRLFQQHIQQENPFNTHWIGIDWDRETLYARINHRVESMVEEGLGEEVQQLLPYASLQALQTVGYREWIDFLNGSYSKEDAIRLIQQNTRHYAKRQLTWFRRISNMQWIKPVW